MHKIDSLRRHAACARYPSRIRDWRIEQEMTQRELAEKAGVTLSPISRAESGYRIRAEKIDKIARALGRQELDVALAIGETRMFRQQHEEIMSVARHNRERIARQVQEMELARERRREEAANQARRRGHLFEWADAISLSNNTGEDEGPYLVRRMLTDLQIVLRERQRERDEGRR